MATYLVFETAQEAQECADNLNSQLEDGDNGEYIAIELSPPELLVRIHACALLRSEGWQMDPELPCLEGNDLIPSLSESLGDPPEVTEDC